MDIAKNKNIYLSQVKKQLSRLISLEDREPFSNTYGCFDRTYWGWKFTDFAGARYQEAVYALAHLYKQPIDGISFAEHEKILQWTKAGLEFWRNLQHTDGSFDEAYPMERSLAATSFTCFYLGEAYLMLLDDLSDLEKEPLHQTFLKAGIWLSQNHEKHGTLSNHLAAAATALQVIYKITGDPRFEQRSKYFLERIYSCQSHEGWYEEYGGADIGYQTHTTFYLSRLWQHTNDEKVLESLKKSIQFLKYFVHPDGTIGGEYGSRNTEFYLPAGFEILATACPEAALIAKFMHQPINDQIGVGLASMDAQNFMPLLNNYLFAADHFENLEPINGRLPFQEEGEWEFPDAGLVVKTNSHYYAIFAPSKGGVLRIYDCKKRKLFLNHCGYWTVLENGKVASNQALNRSGKIYREGNKFITVAPFQKIKQKTFSPFLFIIFRLFSLTFGRAKSIAYWLKNLLVKTLVKGYQSVPIKLTRKVNFSDKEISLADQIEITGNISLKTLEPEARFSTIHMGSSRYFSCQEMDSKPIDKENLLEAIKKNRLVNIEQNFKFE